MVKVFKRLIDNSSVKVTKFTLGPNQNTGYHKHQFDYIIVPITNGKLLSIDKNNKSTEFIIEKGTPYFRNSGVEHDVINKSNSEIIFVEVEILNTSL